MLNLKYYKEDIGDEIVCRLCYVLYEGNPWNFELIYRYEKFQYRFIFGIWVDMNNYSEIKDKRRIPKKFRNIVEDPLFEIEVNRFCLKYKLTIKESI